MAGMQKFCALSEGGMMKMKKTILYLMMVGMLFGSCSIAFSRGEPNYLAAAQAALQQAQAAVTQAQAELQQAQEVVAQKEAALQQAQAALQQAQAAMENLPPGE
jgi:ABC-type transport system involved in cytochrome bd biosynthesis fused ATPase/permease subunit